MKILYLTNIHNPYRDRFFEQLGRQCDLTVLFESRTDSARDSSWFENKHADFYKEIYLTNSFPNALREMLKLVGGGFFLVIVGCYNSPLQMIAINYMRRKGIRYVVNSDGAVFECRSRLKRTIRYHVLNGADGYLTAGKTSVPGLRCITGLSAKVFSYPFSSIDERTIASLHPELYVRDQNRVLVVAQFLEYKGVDVLLDAIPQLPDNLTFRLIGSGPKAEQLVTDVQSRFLINVEVVSFLEPEELFGEFLSAGLLVLPSRQECWGLVINEAAVCGCPIVSTWGAGAAVEFLSHDYPQYLAEPGSSDSLALAMLRFLERPDFEKRAYSNFLREKAADYTIERMTAAHLDMFAKVTS